MKFRGDILLASFIVAVFSSFLTAIGVLLVQMLSISAFDITLFAGITVNIFILFFLSGFIFFKGSALAAWLLYRHDVPWGYKLDYKKVIPIFLSSFLMALIIFFIVYLYLTGKMLSLAYLEKSIQIIENTASFN